MSIDVRDAELFQLFPQLAPHRLYGRPSRAAYLEALAFWPGDPKLAQHYSLPVEPLSAARRREFFYGDFEQHPVLAFDPDRDTPTQSFAQAWAEWVDFMLRWGGVDEPRAIY